MIVDFFVVCLVTWIVAALVVCLVIWIVVNVIVKGCVMDDVLDIAMDFFVVCLFAWIVTLWTTFSISPDASTGAKAKSDVHHPPR